MVNTERVGMNGQFNIGHICTRLQCEAGFGDKTAMVWLSHDGTRAEYTFGDLDIETNRFANVLLSLGLKKGDTVFTFLPKMPEVYTVFLGALKAEIIAGTLFSNFGDDALLHRLVDSQAKCVVTKKSLLKKLLCIRDSLPKLRHIIVVDGDDDPAVRTLSYRKLVENASGYFTSPVTSPDTPSSLHYTSGTTGKPKGVLHRHGSVIHQSRTAKTILKLEPSDRFWCTADPGWFLGISYGIMGPWSLGVTQIHYGGAYEASVWLDILEQEKVSVLYTAPTALRMLMQEDEKLISSRSFDNLRHIFSAGEPLNPEIVNWGRRTFKTEIYDSWFQTETGGLTICNRPGLEIRPGSMGKPAEGVEAAIITDDGRTAGCHEPGHLCIKPEMPSLFINYINNESTYLQKFKNGFYFSGDTAFVDKDGYFWFLGRSDDVINTAGHLVSPFEIESVLLELDEIAESGVVGAPDEVLFEKVVAFVHLHKNYQWTKELELKVRLHVANRSSSLATPQDIVIVDNIPKNKSGKIMRRILKAKYMGTDCGDISDLEVPINELIAPVESYLQARI